MKDDSATRRHRLGVVASIAALVSALGGCASAGYYAQSIGGHLDLMAKRQDIDSLVEDASTPPELKERLLRAQAIRAFATEVLALPNNGSYRSYVDVGKPYVTWNVVATPALSLKPRTWCFPVVGCVAYRGYFEEADAREYGDTLATDGMDVAIVGARAYSTLGWFNDPILNTTLYDAEYRFAGTLFHELAHERVFVAGDTSFNESYAVAVEREGVRRWLDRNAAHAMRDAYALERRRREQFLALVLETRDHLETLFESDQEDAVKVREKAVIYARLRRDYSDLKAAWGGYGGYDGWFASELNNARLALLATYNVYVPAFERLLAEQRGDMEAFHRAVEALARLPKEERDTELERLAAERI